MANKIDKVTVVAGRLIRIWNENKPKFSNANKKYYSVWVEDPSGSNERCLLLTEKELRNAEYRASRNPEDIPKKGILTDLFD